MNKIQFDTQGVSAHFRLGPFLSIIHTDDWWVTRMHPVPNSGNDRISTVPHIAPVEQMAGEDEEETALLRQMLQEAKSYALSFTWCDAIADCYFGGGIGKIIAIFLFKISTRRPEVDPWIWIIVGDIPPAYLPLEDCGSPKVAFDTYVDGMGRWAKLARQGQTDTTADDVPPVNVPATPEWAEQLEGRLRLLNEIASPFFE
jgi:hypothetical protein